MFSKIKGFVESNSNKAVSKSREIEKEIKQKEERIEHSIKRMENWDKNTKLIRRK
jgi:hypothetical protein